jgi:septal ring factor EnvC (AmiA/AmiB activator)
MKRILPLLIILALPGGPALHAQDAAVEERLKKLNGLVEDLLEDKAAQRKRLDALARELDSLREQQNRPNASYATTDDLKRLAERIQEIDRKREADKELILARIAELGKAFSASTAANRRPPPPEKSSAPARPEKGYEHVVRSGETLSVIIQAFREEGIKVTLDQVVKANPGLNPDRLQIGQKIFIPAP